jgi:predicted O-methyltransferase YrrM
MKGWDLVADLGGDVELLKIVTKGLVKRFRHQDLHFHPVLYGLVRALKPTMVVETGVYLGASTYFILAALRENREGTLFSCDPKYVDKRRAQMMASLRGAPMNRWLFIGQRSEHALHLAKPPWDIFLHDSDHRRKNMAFELDYAWKRVCPGGLIIVDDWQGLPRPHNAFRAFTKKVGARVEFLEPRTAVVFRGDAS